MYKKKYWVMDVSNKCTSFKTKDGFRVKRKSCLKNTAWNGGYLYFKFIHDAINKFKPEFQNNKLPNTIFPSSKKIRTKTFNFSWKFNDFHYTTTNHTNQHPSVAGLLRQGPSQFFWGICSWFHKIKDKRAIFKNKVYFFAS